MSAFAPRPARRVCAATRARGAVTGVVCLATLAALAAPAATAHARGVVEVSFVEPERYTDIGWRPADRERNLETLGKRLRDKADRLPDGQTLKVEVLDVDLAGAEFVMLRHPEIRVLKGRADWPRMQLRYTLSADGRTLRSGQDQVQDMAYMERSAGLPHMDALAYDLRLLDEWFERRVIRGESP